MHWNGQNWRFLPTRLRAARSTSTQRYGAGFIPDDMTIQDWGVTYDELEPYYDRFEYLCGISGKAGNLDGQDPAGRQSVRRPAQRDYPAAAAQAQPRDRCCSTRPRARSGFHPFPCPAANTSQPYKNLYGVQMGACTYCGYCEWFGCGNYSKSSPQT